MGSFRPRRDYRPSSDIASRMHGRQNFQLLQTVKNIKERYRRIRLFQERIEGGQHACAHGVLEFAYPVYELVYMTDMVIVGGFEPLAREWKEILEQLHHPTDCHVTKSIFRSPNDICNLDRASIYAGRDLRHPVRRESDENRPGGCWRDYPEVGKLLQVSAAALTGPAFSNAMMRSAISIRTSAATCSPRSQAERRSQSSSNCANACLSSRASSRISRNGLSMFSPWQRRNDLENFEPPAQ